MILFFETRVLCRLHLDHPCTHTHNTHEERENERKREDQLRVFHQTYLHVAYHWPHNSLLSVFQHLHIRTHTHTSSTSITAMVLVEMLIFLIIFSTVNQPFSYLLALYAFRLVEAKEIKRRFATSSLSLSLSLSLSCSLLILFGFFKTCFAGMCTHRVNLQFLLFYDHTHSLDVDFWLLHLMSMLDFQCIITTTITLSWSVKMKWVWTKKNRHKRTDRNVCAWRHICPTQCHLNESQSLTHTHRCVFDRHLTGNLPRSAQLFFNEIHVGIKLTQQSDDDHRESHRFFLKSKLSGLGKRKKS